MNMQNAQLSELKESIHSSLRFFFAGMENHPLLSNLSDNTLDASKYLSQKNSLSVFEKSIEKCTNCDLHASRTKFVFGYGNPSAKICFIGSQPSATDESHALPFQGEEGELLEKMIHAMGLQKENVYLMNIIKCRPAGDRKPHEAEIEACTKHALEQISLINPTCIVALGELAARTILRTNTSLSDLRVRTHFLNDATVIATHHPQDLLKNSSLKKAAWADLQLAMQVLKN